MGNSDTTKQTPRLPPGSRLPTLAQSAIYGLRPTEVVWRWRRKFGDVFTVKLLPTGPFAYVTDPEIARSIFAGDQSRLHAGESNRMLEPVNGPSSIVVLDDAAHSRARRLLLPLFRPARIAAHADLIARVTRRQMRSWPQDRPFALAPRMQDIALEVIVRTTLGDEDRIVAELKSLLPRLLRANTWTWLPGLGRDLGPLSPAGRLRRLTASIDAILHVEIARRRDRSGTDGGSSLSYLIEAEVDGRRLDDAELRDHLATLLLSGHETTSSSLAWAFERVLRHRHVVERIRAEGAADETPYLDATVKEVLRCRPAVMDTGRVLKGEQAVGGRMMPAGSSARVAISTIQQRPELFADPEAFRPERFLSGEVDPGDWMPFGGGARRCLGAALATLEMKVVLATVLSEAELVPARRGDEAAAFRAPHLTLSPARGCRVILTGRPGPSQA